VGSGGGGGGGACCSHPLTRTGQYRTGGGVNRMVLILLVSDEGDTDGGLFQRFLNHNGRNGHLKSVEACVCLRASSTKLH